ncbi:MAG: VCBS repeat-containing protein [Planctomycetes bacterium]|nr:VCBS repeat-containing protein [Planctomycetota bacterium]
MPGGPDGLERTGASLGAVNEPVGLLRGDYDGDGLLDIAALNGGSKTVTWMRGRGSGLEPAGEALQLDERPAAGTSADFDADGYSDIAVAGASRWLTQARGGPRGFRAPERIDLRRSAGSSVAFASGELNGDGFPDLLLAIEAADRITYLQGGADGLRWTAELEAGKRPRALAVGDQDGDGLLDAVVASLAEDKVALLRQRYLVPHANRVVEPGATPREELCFLDPRRPPRYRLELPEGAFSSPTQVCIMPAPLFDLPRRSAPEESLTVVTDTVAVLKERTELNAPAKLTLRLRDTESGLPADVLKACEDLEACLRVFRKDPDQEVGIALQLQAGQLKLVELEGGQGVELPISRFGTYVVALKGLRGH